MQQRSVFKIRRARSPRAFTLIELLVVIAIIGILAALIFPTLSKMEERGHGATCTANLRQIGSALLLYAGDENGRFPLAGNVVPYGSVDADTGRPGWTEQLEPYLGTGRKIFVCPSSSKRIKTNKTYSYFLGTHATYLDSGGQKPLELVRIKSPSRYILGGDISRTGTEDDADKDDMRQNVAFPASGSVAFHQGRANLLFADGGVRSFEKFDSEQMEISYEGTGFTY